jgi:sugar phosphate isomerase/epimerase
MTRFGTPFRLGSTSYVYPADLLTNVERLSTQGEVDDIELVLFDLEDGTSNLPDLETVQHMDAFARIHAVSFTVHLPLDLRFDDSAHLALQKAQKVIQLTQPLHPFAYICHLDGTGVTDAGWITQAIRALEWVLEYLPEPQHLALENLENYDPAYLEPVFDGLPISRTLDIGHLWKMGRNPLLALDVWLPRTRIVHLHGMAQTDHCSLALMSSDQLDPVVEKLMEFHGVLSLEVFEQDDFFTSREALLASMHRIQHG